MKISGFTIVRNALLMGYPAKESIESILPLCDEFIVNVGDSDDDTPELIQSIGSDKLIILHTKWDENIRLGGQILSQQTNVALSACTGDWAFYLQSDEVIHEKEHPYLLEKMREYLENPAVEGLSFRYLHFYGSYQYVQDNYRRWYPREVRIVRKSEDIVSWGDAMDFRHKDGSKLAVARIKSHVYHYGWVKTPQKMLNKKKSLDKLWHDDTWISREYQDHQEFDYPDRSFLVKFKGAHPHVMQQRVAAFAAPFDPRKTFLRCSPLRQARAVLYPLSKRIKRVFGKF